MPGSEGILKDHMKQKMMNSYEMLHDCWLHNQMIWDLLLRMEWVLLYICNKPFIPKESLFYKLHFMYIIVFFGMQVSHSLQYAYSMHSLLSKLSCGLSAYISKLVCGFKG